MLGPTTFKFLNKIHTLESSADWNNPTWSHLWIYHLHYFDDLSAVDADCRAEWHSALIQRWIAENPPASGVGWEPYPMSRRIVNWIKWALNERSITTRVLDSLAVQVRFLSQRLERHLLGNHLLANLKALFFAECLFTSAWRVLDDQTDYGLAFCREFTAQMDDNGAHYELSPMYHALVLEDALDVMNIAQLHARSDVWAMLEKPVDMMCRWLSSVTHPDGQIALFNDSAFGMSLPCSALVAYASRLGLSKPHVENVELLCAKQAQTGYIRWQCRSAVALLDCAPIGPDHLPAHGHADYLTFELSLGKQRVVVDTGTSVYASGAERLEQRGTRAHNTPIVNNRNSADVWGSFRVGRRARVRMKCIHEHPLSRVLGWHNGYRNLGVVFIRREWILSLGVMKISDRLARNRRRQTEKYTVEIPFHLHPDLMPEVTGKRSVNIYHHDGSFVCRFEFDQPLDISLRKYMFHPEFGLSIPAYQIVGYHRGILPREFKTIISWVD